MIALKRLAPVLGLVAVAGLAACSKDSLSPDTVNPQALANGTTDLTSAITSNPGFVSLSALSNAFPQFAASAALRASLPAAPVAHSWAASVDARRSALVSYSTRGPAGTQALFPSNVLGRTFVWDVTANGGAGGYVIDPNVTGAPAAGVRFRLYVVDPATGKPLTNPLQQLGYVDLTDESTPQADIIGVKVQYQSATIADYKITGTKSTLPPSVTLGAVGYITDGTNRVNFNLQNSLTISATAATIHIDYELSKQGGVTVHLVLTATGTQTSASVTLTFTISEGGNTIEISGSGTETGTARTVTVTIKFNGTVVASATGDPDSATITGTGGRQLSAQEIQALATLLQHFGAVFEDLDGLFRPGEVIFHL